MMVQMQPFQLVVLPCLGRHIKIVGEFEPSLGAGKGPEGGADEMEETIPLWERFHGLLQLQVFGTGIMDNELDDRVLHPARHTTQVRDPAEIKPVIADSIMGEQLLHFRPEPAVVVHVFVKVIKDE